MEDSDCIGNNLVPMSSSSFEYLAQYLSRIRIHFVLCVRFIGKVRVGECNRKSLRSVQSHHSFRSLPKLRLVPVYLYCPPISDSGHSLSKIGLASDNCNKMRADPSARPHHNVRAACTGATATESPYLPRPSGLGIPPLRVFRIAPGRSLKGAPCLSRSVKRGP